MAVFLSPLGGAGWQFFDNNGNPLTGGLLYTYAAGTTMPQTTYTSNSGLTTNSNPIVLDSVGRVVEEVWLTEGISYKLELRTSSNVTIWTKDNISGVNDLSALAAPNGSSLIGFIQAGTGAEATTVQTKLRQTLSVFDFMTALEIADVSTNTGSLDVTQAIQDAINAVYSPAQNVGWGGTLIFPPGTYKTTAALTIDKHINIEAYGARVNSSGARCFDIGNAAYLTDLGAGYYRVRIAGLYINHAGANEVIRNQGIRRIVLERVQTIGGSHALYTEGAFDSPVITNCRFQNTTSHGINIAQRNNLLAIYNTAVLGTAGYGIHMNTAGAELKGIKLYSADVEGCAGGIFIGGNTGNVLMDGCWFENNTVFNIRVDNTAGTANKYGISIYNSQITGAGVDVVIGNDAAGGTLIVGVEVSACEFVDSDLAVIGGDKVTEFVEFANRRSGTSVFTIPAAALAGPLGAAAVRYGTAPTEPFGFAASGVQGDVRYGAGRMWVKNSSGWLMLQGAAVEDYSTTMQSLPTGATPSAANLHWAATNNSGATTITNFTDGYVGQELILWGADGGNTTIGHGTNIRLAGGANFTLGTDDTIHLMRTNTKWVEVARSNNV